MTSATMKLKMREESRRGYAKLKMRNPARNKSPGETLINAPNVVESFQSFEDQWRSED